MRWFWIDCFTEFARRRRACAIKTVTLGEEHLHDHFPGAAMMPNTLVLEGMAQTAGLLVADALDFKLQVVLAKVSSVDFAFEALPGDTLEYTAEIVEISSSGSLVRVTSRVAGREQATADLYFGHMEAGTVIPKLFKDEEMVHWLDALRIFEVAVDEAGNRIPRRSSTIVS